MSDDETDHDIDIASLRKKYADLPPPDVRIKTATTCKIAGNEAYVKKLYKVAAKSYQEAIETIENEYDFTAFEALEAKELRVACHSNFAQCMLNLGNNYEARKSCDEALEINDEHAKTMYRRGLAHSNLSAFEAARKDFKCALALEPDNKNVRKQLEKLQKRIDKHKRKEKKVFKKAFENLDGVFSENRDGDVSLLEKWCRWAEDRVQSNGPWIATLLQVCLLGGKAVGSIGPQFFTTSSRGVCSLMFLVAGFLQLRWSYKRKGDWLPSWLPFREQLSWVSGSLSTLVAWTMIMARTSSEMSFVSKVAIIVVMCSSGMAALGEESRTSKRIQDRALRASSMLMMLALLTGHASS